MFAELLRRLVPMGPGGGLRFQADWATAWFLTFLGLFFRSFSYEAQTGPGRLPGRRTDRRASRPPRAFRFLPAQQARLDDARRSFGDSAALADALERLALDASLRERMGRAGRETILREFDQERCAADLVGLIQRWGGLAGETAVALSSTRSPERAIRGPVLE